MEQKCPTEHVPNKLSNRLLFSTFTPYQFDRLPCSSAFLLFFCKVFVSKKSSLSHAPNAWLNVLWTSYHFKLWISKFGSQNLWPRSAHGARHRSISAAYLWSPAWLNRANSCICVHISHPVCFFFPVKLLVRRYLGRDSLWSGQERSGHNKWFK